MLPNHRVTMKELRLIPLAFYELLLARLIVSLAKADQYLPNPQSEQFNPIDVLKHDRAKNIAAVVNGVGRRTPWQSTCLVKALAAHKLLVKRKIPHSFHLGVQKGMPHNLKAHAWISVAGKVIIGGAEAFEFIEIRRVDVT